MGLMYPYPVSSNEQDHVKIQKSNDSSTITVKSYGLPYIFWGYLLAVLIVIIFMVIAIKDPLNRLIATNDPINVLMGQCVWLTLALTPAAFTTLFFIENRIIKKQSSITLKTYIFWLPVKSKQYRLKAPNSLHVSRFEGTPNVAKMQNSAQMKTHQNKGYFELFGLDESGKEFLIDRHSRKADLDGLKSLLEKY